MINLYLLCADLKNTQSNMRKQSNTIIYEMYTFLNAPSEKTKCILDAWKEEFSYIYGDVNTNISSNSKLNPKELLEEYGISYDDENWPEEIQLLFYSIQTYFSVMIKCLMKNMLAKDAKMNTTDIILGKFASDSGVENYCYEDWYCWPIFEEENGFEATFKNVLDSLNKYIIDISINEFVSNNNNDYIKQMYEAIIPKELRHALGEYYTPDWLAELTLKQVCDQSNKSIKELSFIDPTCGSGTFLFKTIAAKRNEEEDVKKIVQSVFGFDINPLAVLTAKTNYLLSVIDLISNDTPITLPVYNVDVVRMGDEEEPVLDDFLTSVNPANSIRNRILEDRKIALNMNKMDVIIGNPPWVNWEYMPEKYRTSSQHKWLDYDLFTAKGRDLSFAKEDISVLITYIVMDILLKKDGILAFVIRQGVFKSAQNGVGFRKFKIKDECEIKVLRVDDLSKIKAFDNATNSTAVFYAKKGVENIYPVPYFLWEKRADLNRCSFNAYSDFKEVLSQMNIKEQHAMPAVESDISSIWITAEKDSLELMSKILGTNEYRARTGVFTGGANAVYWLNINSASDDLINISNIVERAKRKAEKVDAEIEKTYVFPMLKGSNVKKWKTMYNTYLLCPHTAETKMWPVAQDVLKEQCPRTYDYLLHFKENLDGRKGFAGWEKEIQKQEFQAILRIGDYTFSKYKVIWKYIASEFVCAVISTVDDKYLGEKMLMPNEKIMYVSMDDEQEAYYLCGILSSTIVADCVKSYMNPTSISAHVLNKLDIPQFDPNNNDHIEIAKICKEGHGKGDIEPFIYEIDAIVKRIYDI